MDVRIIVGATAKTGEKRTQELQRLSPPGQYQRDLGLNLDYGKVLLARLKQAIVHHQIEEISDASRKYPRIGPTRPACDYGKENVQGIAVIFTTPDETLRWSLRHDTRRLDWTIDCRRSGRVCADICCPLGARSRLSLRKAGETPFCLPTLQ